MIAIIDYGMGNLRSVQKALEKAGGQTLITHDRRDIQVAEKVVLPGVGAMQPAMDRLKELQLIDPILSVAAEKPFLGICLGLQLLFNTSTEGGQTSGLGIVPGSARRFTGLKVPHMGWNQLNIEQGHCPLFQNIENGTDLYFCHSYYVDPDDESLIAGTTDYGIPFTSAVWRDNLFAVQFHPEKSQDAGLKILENFVNLQEASL